MEDDWKTRRCSFPALSARTKPRDHTYSTIRSKRQRRPVSSWTRSGIGADIREADGWCNHGVLTTFQHLPEFREQVVE